jgi:hypothetical protein
MPEKSKQKLSLCVIKPHATMAYREVLVQLYTFLT